MTIKNLADTDITEIVECMTKSFENYFVKLPSEVDFWAKRYEVARVDYGLSYGVFDNEKLVAFIIHGIDFHNGKKTAFNTGTGVLEEYRGKKLVDHIYDFSIPKLKANGITKCLLEVIDENHRAIRVYERIGFQKGRFLRCFKGHLTANTNDVSIREMKIEDLKASIEKYQQYYSWDNMLTTVLSAKKSFKSYIVLDRTGSESGYFIINPSTNSLVQIEAFDNEDWAVVLGGTQKVISSIRINNVDYNRSYCTSAFINAGLENHVNQFEMELQI